MGIAIFAILCYHLAVPRSLVKFWHVLCVASVIGFHLTSLSSWEQFTKGFVEQKGVISSFIMVSIYCNRQGSRYLDCMDKLISSLGHERKKAERATESSAYFLEMLSTEMKSPLIHINGWAELFLGNTSMEQHIIYDKVKAVQFSSNYLLSILVDLMDYAKLLNNQLKLESKPFSILDLVKRVINTIPRDKV